MEGEGAVRVAEYAPAANGEEPIRPSAESVQENPLPGTPQNPGDPSDPKPDRNEIFRALEVVERDSTAIAESFASLFSSLRLALSEGTSTSVENMQCFGEVVGRLQESALDAASKGNRYINSCLRLNEEMKSLETLSMQLKILRKNVDSLDMAVNQLLRLP
ncbi:Monocopper oxidase-like protein SKS2 [Cocos nucifera]|uniref:Monocopper oxidase-like protein SKS2 n=1 Tax=Cocos nucifera TaxID=13894 RepID=A0A8K0IG85_COCNU|nr:Monocopper oxidase-like protein SKS2 [Cocos nucifera]